MSTDFWVQCEEIAWGCGKPTALVQGDAPGTKEQIMVCVLSDVIRQCFAPPRLAHRCTQQ